MARVKKIKVKYYECILINGYVVITNTILYKEK